MDSLKPGAVEQTESRVRCPETAESVLRACGERTVRTLEPEDQLGGSSRAHGFIEL